MKNTAFGDSSLLTSNPCHMTRDGRIGLQRLQGVESSAQFHLAIQLVQTAMATMAQQNAGIALFTSELLLEALATMQLAGYQMMKGQCGLTTAQLTVSLFQRHCRSGCNNRLIRPVQPV